MALWMMKAMEKSIVIISVAMSQLFFSESPKGESPQFQIFSLNSFQSENYVLRKIVSKAWFLLKPLHWDVLMRSVRKPPTNRYR